MTTSTGETELQMVQRHVREGVDHVKRQGEVVADLRKLGAPTATAISLLKQFEDIQRQHKAHLTRLEAAEPRSPKRTTATNSRPQG